MRLANNRDMLILTLEGKGFYIFTLYNLKIIAFLYISKTHIYKHAKYSLIVPFLFIPDRI